MPFINLIQEQRLVAQANERKSRSFFLTFVGVLTASGLAVSFLTMETIIAGRQASGVEAQNKKNAPLVSQIDQNAKALAELTPRVKTLEDAQVITSRWSRILEHLAVQTPHSTWLTTMRCLGSDPTKPIQISFAGIATAQSPIGEFIMRMQNLADLDNVNLKFTNEKLIANKTGIEFQVDADLVGTTEQQVKREDKEGEASK